MALTREEKQTRNSTRCKRYYETHKAETHKRRILNQIKRQGYFPRAIESLTTLELVEAFSCYQQFHTPSEFSLCKFRNFLANK